MTSPVTQNHTWPRLSSAASAAAAVALAVIAALDFSSFGILFDPSVYGDFGFSTGQNQGLIGLTTVGAVVPGSSADRAGIKVGDTLERPPSLHDRLLIYGLTVPRPGERLTLSIVRGGERHEVRLHARTTTALSAIERIGVGVLLVVLLVSVIIALVLVLLRPSKMTWGYYLFAFMIAAALSTPDWGLFSQKLSAASLVSLALLPQDVFMAFGIIGYLIFCLRFPASAPKGWRAATDHFASYLAVALAALFVIRDLGFIDFRPRVADSLTHVIDAIGLSSFALGTIAFLSTYNRARGLERHRIKWVLVGLGCALIPLASLVFSLEGLFNPPGWVLSLLNLLYLPLPIAVAYAVIRHRVIDIRFVVSRALVLGVVAAIVALIVIGFDWFFSARLPTSRFDVAIIAGVAILVGFSLNALRERIGKTIDFLFFRQWLRTQEQAQTIADAVRGATSLVDLYEPLTAGIARAFSLASAALFERVEDGGFVRVAAFGWPAGTLWNILLTDPLVTCVDRELRTTSIDSFQWQWRVLPAGVARPTVMLPIAVGRQVPAILLCGEHENGTSIDADEVRAIRRLCADAGLVYGVTAAPGWARTAFVTARHGVQ